MLAFGLMLKTFPFWAVPLAIILFEVGFFYKRRRSDAKVVFFGASGFLICLALAWLVLRGDLHAEAWVRAMQGY
jgi:hypothetical protein